MSLSVVLALSLPPTAFACPTIATGTTNPLNFETAQVAIVRQGDHTTFSVSINPLGEKQGFALVLPVPELLLESQVRTLDPSVFAALDGYSGPRHVTDAGCPSDQGLFPQESTADSAGADESGDGAVTVEAEYLVGEYQVTILSAEESNALGTWLTANGYYLPEGAEPRLSEYIEAGSYFLAAKVADEAAAADGTPLSPLQISYQSEIFSIPLRLATLNSPGEQDMVIYAINDMADGRAGIANYPEFEVASGCIWGDPARDEFVGFYADRFREAWARQGDAAWTVEYAGAFGDCNPCSNVSIDETHLADLGFTGDAWNHYLTRMHARYTPEQADQDLTIYHSGIAGPKVSSFADDNKANRTCIDTCEAVDARAAGECSCGSGAQPEGLAALAVAVLAAVRRRRAW